MKKTLLGKTFLLLILFASAQRASAQFKVIGYMPSWAGDVNTVQYTKLTHINYAFLLPTATGGLQSIENPSKLQSLVTRAHANNVKVMISVGGWNNGDDSQFESLAGNTSYRNTFVNNHPVDAGKAFTIYPNPVKQQLNIVSGEPLAGGSIRIYDVNGKLVIDARTATNRIDVSSLSSGVYTLLYTKNQTKITKKFVK